MHDIGTYTLLLNTVLKIQEDFTFKSNYTKSSVNDTRVILNRILTKNWGVILGPSIVLRVSSNQEILLKRYAVYILMTDYLRAYQDPKWEQ